MANRAFPGRSKNTTQSRGTFRGTRRISPYARTKPEGGFCFIPAMAILATWWAYKRGILGLVDVRVWLANYEVVARRCGERPNRFPDSVEHELADLVGVSSEQCKASLRKLMRRGLICPIQTRFQDHVLIEGLDPGEQDELIEYVRSVDNHRRRVPVPRRLMRHLCSVSRPVLWATTLGHLLRCMYYRDAKCAPDGRCKASWVAEVFDVDGRNVKAARRELVRLGLLIMTPTDQCSMNRWGPRVRFNLDWAGWKPVASPPPPQRGFAPGLPPPKRNRKLVSRMGDQKPLSLTGACRGARRWRVEDADLACIRNLNGLFDRLVVAGECRPGEAARLAFFSLAARTRRVARLNPGGLLATLVRRRLWHYAAHLDEDTARNWIRAMDEGGSVQAGKPRAPSGELGRESGMRANMTEPASAGNILVRLLPEAARGLVVSVGWPKRAGPWERSC